MQKSKYYIRGRKDYQLNLLVVLKTLKDQWVFKTIALLNSKYIDFYINWQFINKHHIPTQQMLILIPMYNADRTWNQAGPIIKMAELILAIGEH